MWESRPPQTGLPRDRRRGRVGGGQVPRQRLGRKHSLVALNAITRVLVRERQREVCLQDRPHEDRGRDGADAATSSRSWTRREGPSPRALGELTTSPCCLGTGAASQNPPQMGRACLPCQGSGPGPGSSLAGLASTSKQQPAHPRPWAGEGWTHQGQRTVGPRAGAPGLPPLQDSHIPAPPEPRPGSRPPTSQPHPRRGTRGADGGQEAEGTEGSYSLPTELTSQGPTGQQALGVQAGRGAGTACPPR